jgi:hypothetical protein
MPTSSGNRHLAQQRPVDATCDFRHDESELVEEQILDADTNEQAEANFGLSVDIDDDVIAVGAPNHDVSSNSNAGKAYVFRYNSGMSTWDEEDDLAAGDVEAGARFGDSVSVSGDRLAVGAPMADYTPTPISDTGAAYIFDESSGVWSQSFKLHASDRAEDDAFSNVSLEGDRLLVGAPGDGSNMGAAYVLEFSGLAANPPHWAEDQKITATGGAAGEQFGKAAALDGNRLLVGADLADVGTTNAAGAAYVFDYVSNDWSETDELTALVPLVPSVATHALNCHRARFADAETGRWLTRDPIGYVGSKNLVLFALARPTVYRDYLGLLSTLGNRGSTECPPRITNPPPPPKLTPCELDLAKAKQDPRIQEALRALSGIGCKPILTCEDGGADGCFYRHSEGRVKCSQSVNVEQILHELVHAWQYCQQPKEGQIEPVRDGQRVDELACLEVQATVCSGICDDSDYNGTSTNTPNNCIGALCSLSVDIECLSVAQTTAEDCPGYKKPREGQIYSDYAKQKCIQAMNNPKCRNCDGVPF